jgi:hypothetical protein
MVKRQMDVPAQFSYRFFSYCQQFLCIIVSANDREPFAASGKRSSPYHETASF